MITRIHILMAFAAIGAAVVGDFVTLLVFALIERLRKKKQKVFKYRRAA